MKNPRICKNSSIKRPRSSIKIMSQHLINSSLLIILKMKSVQHISCVIFGFIFTVNRWNATEVSLWSASFNLCLLHSFINRWKHSWKPSLFGKHNFKLSSHEWLGCSILWIFIFLFIFACKQQVWKRHEFLTIAKVNM